MNLALFDLDNTLLSIDSDHAWGRFLVARGIVDRVEFDRRNDYFFDRYKAGTLDIHEYLEFALAPLARRDRAEIDAWHSEFMRTVILPAITPSARALVRRHLDAGDLCCCVTATNAFVTAPIAIELRIPHLIAVDLEEHGGVFTGKPRGIPSFQDVKIKRVEGWLATMDRRVADFPRSWFYSDSRNDIPLLERVTDPVAVDPDEALGTLARQRGWRVISLRA